MAKPKSCVTKQIRNKRGKVVAQFRGRTGAACGPRKKPSTAHLRPYKAAMKRAAKAYKGSKGKNFQHCVSGQLHR